MSVCPDSIEPVTAWRAWRAIRDSEEEPWRLRSCIHIAAWEPRERLEALCRQATKQHLAPNRKCQCGIYAAKEAFPVLEYASPFGPGYAMMWMTQKPQGVPDVRVFGQVKMWGKVHEYEKGYRGLYAYPVRLWVVTKPAGRSLYDNVAWDMADYRVPVGFVDGGERGGLRDSLQLLVDEHPV